MNLSKSARIRRIACVVLVCSSLVWIFGGEAADVAAFTCSTSAHSHAIVQSTDVLGNSGTGLQASWQEQDFTVADWASNGFVNAEEWVIINAGPNQQWNETGFTRRERFLHDDCYGNCFFIAYGNDNVSPHLYNEERVAKAPVGTPHYHTYRLVWNSVTTNWDTWIDGTNYGGYHNPAYLKRVDVGIEATDNCSSMSNTYFGGPATPDAFQYRVGINGFWTTWGSGNICIDHSPSEYHVAWDKYAIYMHVWGPVAPTGGNC